MPVVGRLDQYASMLAYEFDDYSMSENLLLYSEQINNAIWTKSNLNISTNQIAAPDGTTTAELLTGPSGSNLKFLSQSYTASTSGAYTFSIFAKAGTESFIVVELYGAAGTNPSVRQRFNLTTGTLDGSVSASVVTNASSSITDAGNGWYRCSVSATFPSVTYLESKVWLNQYAVVSVTTNFYIWGAQLETGSVATDYTPTTITSINRVLASTTNTNITGLGTYYSSGFDENVGFTTFLSANVFAPYDLVYDEVGGTLFGVGQGRYMRQNTDKSVIVYNEIDEVTTIY
jgi:hypothetical protein